MTTEIDDPYYRINHWRATKYSLRLRIAIRIKMQRRAGIWHGSLERADPAFGPEITPKAQSQKDNSDTKLGRYFQENVIQIDL